MQILDSENRFDTAFTLQREWIPTIDFKTVYENKIVNEYASIKGANEKMLELLQFFNTQIFAVNMQARTYSVHYEGEDRVLAISCLSRGEKLLAMCLMANESKNKVYLSGEVSQLAKPTMLKLIEMFKNSEYVNLVPPTDMYTNLLRSLL